MKSPKTRADNTLTESQFLTMLRSALRNRSRFWTPIQNTKQKARRKYTGDNKRQKWEYQCAICKEWHNDKNIQVDHIQEVGTLSSVNDLPQFVENLFCDSSNLQVLCTKCHNKKTQDYRKSKKGED